MQLKSVERRYMKKVLKCLWAIIETALLGSITIFTGAAVFVVLAKFADKYLNNNIFSCIFLGIILLSTVLFVGTEIKEKLGK